MQTAWWRWVGVAALVLSSGSARSETTPTPMWLDQATPGWNRAGASMPPAPPPEEGTTFERCAAQIRPATTPEDRAVIAAGWRLFGALQAYGGTVVVQATSGADGMCRPLGYQAFVFVDGRFAGTLAPHPMNARTDGALDAVHLDRGDTLRAEFRRYAASDPLCCPSRLSTATYRIERAAGGAVLEPGHVSTVAIAR